MNKFSSIVIVMLSFLASYAQDESSTTAAVEDRKHEVRLGTLKLLAGGIIEGSYEYILDENQGFGTQLLVNLNKNSDYLENFSVTPYYRFYFQTKEDYGARGFFVEGFSSFFLTDFELDNNIETIDSDNVFEYL